MVDFDFCYFVPSVPSKVAQSFLQRNFRWSPTMTSDHPIYLFARYIKGPVPDSYQSAVKAFPDNCVLSSNKARSPALIIAADPFTFTRIYTYLESLSCQVLYHEIHSQLFPDRQTPTFKIRNQVWDQTRPRVMAILNITPDSFYDGGVYYEKPDYAEIAERLVNEGADIIDIGGESTRPGSESVTADEEIRRILPAVRQIRKRFQIPISIDTTKPSVAKVMFEEGADMVNDISGLSGNREMIDTIRDHGGSYCLMHILGKPRTMQKSPEYGDLIAEIHGFLKTKLDDCVEAGLEKDRIILDPGIGFGKTVLDNMDLLNFLPAFSNLECAILIGTSNKAFIGRLLDRELDQRLAGSLTTQIFGWTKGASVFRVHAVKETRDALTLSELYTRGYQEAATR